MYQTKTVGSRGGDLRPELVDSLVRGFNSRVIEYSKNDKEAIVIVWCCDHPLMHPSEQKNQTDLEQFDTDPSVLNVLTSHPKSPAKFCQISISGHSPPIEAVDEKNKKVTVGGITASYLRKETRKDTKGEEIDVYVLDEG